MRSRQFDEGEGGLEKVLGGLLKAGQPADHTRSPTALGDKILEAEKAEWTIVDGGMQMGYF